MNKPIAFRSRRLARRVGHRGAALLFFALLDVVYCLTLLVPTASYQRGETYQFLSKVMPVPYWAILWGLVGAACLVNAFRRRDRTGFAAAIGLKVLWASVNLGGQISGDLERGYVAAVIWGAFAALVGLLASWPEPPEGELWTQR